MRSTIVIGVISVIAAVALAGCGATGPEQGTTPGASPTPIPSSSPTVATIDPDRPLDDQLFEALRAGDVDLTRALLNAGADVNAEFAQRSNPLDLAIARNDVELVAAVLAAGPDLQRDGDAGQPPLVVACQYGATDAGIFRALLEAGADPLATGIYAQQMGFPPLHACAHSNNAGGLAVLLEAGVDVDLLHEQFHAPAIVFAAHGGSVQTAALLLEAGADPTLVPEGGQSARDWAEWSGSEELIALLDLYGG